MSTGPAARPHVSQQRYLLRRVVAGVILGLVLLGLWRLVSGIVDGDDSGALGPAPTATDPVGDDSAGDGAVGDGAVGDGAVGDGAVGDGAVGDGVVGDGVVGDGVAGDGVAGDGVAGDGAAGDGAVGDGAAGDAGAVNGDAAGGAAEPAGPPTPENPATVLIVGDSDAGTFGPYLQQLLAETGVVETRLDYKVSSGLARPDFFDWNAELAEVVPATDPDIVVVTFGGNDGQFLADRDGGVVVPQPTEGGDHSEWTAEYRARVASVLEQLAADDRTVVWVGIPNHVDPDVTFRMRLQDQAVRAELAEHPDVVFVDTWTRFAGRNGGFAPYVIDPRDGIGKPVRASDGFHLNEVGAEILAIDISQVVIRELRERGAPI